MLSKSAEYAGISTRNFPWKTGMWVSENHILVIYGYGARPVYLYSNKTYWQSKIDSLKEDIEYYKNGEFLFYIENEEERLIKANKCIANIEQTIIEYQDNLINSED